MVTCAQAENQGVMSESDTPRPGCFPGGHRAVDSDGDPSLTRTVPCVLELPGIRVPFLGEHHACFLPLGRKYSNV